MNDSWLVRQNKRNAELSLRSRLRKAASYAGLVWAVMIVGAFVLKYGFDMIERPILPVLVESIVLPVCLFGGITYGYWKADRAKRLQENKDR